VVSDEALAQAEGLVHGVFSGATDAVTPEELPGRLEQTLALGRAAWPRGPSALADAMLERPKDGALAGAGDALAQLCGCAAAGLRVSGTTIASNRSGASHAPSGFFGQPVAERDRVVDLLGRVAGPHRGQQVSCSSGWGRRCSPAASAR